MTVELIEGILFATIRSGTPLLLIGMGVLICERSGVVNLGQEGMVLVGAVVGYITTHGTGNPYLGCLSAVFAGALFSGLFAFLVLGLRTNQVATGLALTVFGSGFAAFLGTDYVGISINGMQTDPLVYVSALLFAALSFLFSRTRVGTLITAVGHNPRAAHQLGYPVRRIRLMAILFGGALAGLAGGYLAIAHTPLWTEAISAGRGWIALALVVFAGWRLGRLMVGAYLFGFAGILHLVLQGVGLDIPAAILAMLPYVVTILALVFLASRNQSRPQDLGVTYHPGG